MIMAKDPRLSVPAFRAEHLEVCRIYREIRELYMDVEGLRRASGKDPRAALLLKRYQDALARRRDAIGGEKGLSRDPGHSPGNTAGANR